MLAESQLARLAVLPYIIGSNAVPVIAVAPLVLMWFGYGFLSRAVVSAFLCFFPLCINAYRGLQAADTHFRELFEVYGETQGRIPPEGSPALCDAVPLRRGQTERNICSHRRRSWRSLSVRLPDSGMGWCTLPTTQMRPASLGLSRSLYIVRHFLLWFCLDLRGCVRSRDIIRSSPAGDSSG